MVMHVDVNLRRLAMAPLGLLANARLRLTLSAPLRNGALASAKLLPPLVERLLSLHALGPEKVGFGQIVATVDTGRATLGLRDAALRHTDTEAVTLRFRGPAGTTAAERRRPPLRLHKIHVLLSCVKVQAIRPHIFSDRILAD
jgi:hypothetical protein